MSAAMAAVDNAELWIAAATPWETKPLAARLGLRPSRAGFAGAVAGRPARLLPLGMGCDSARAALEAAWTGAPPALLLHTGFAGAAQPGLRPGTLVLDVWGVNTALRDGAKAAAARAGLDYQIGRIGSSPRVLRTAAEKAEFGSRRRAAAVDMENEAVQAWARERGVACLSAKAVLDALDDELPEQAPRSDSPADMALYVAARWKELPALAGLWRRQRSALRSLELFTKAFAESYEGL